MRGCRQSEDRHVLKARNLVPALCRYVAASLSPNKDCGAGFVRLCRYRDGPHQEAQQQQQSASRTSGRPSR